MPVHIVDFEVVVPSAESTPAPVPSPTASAGPVWSVELARKLDEQLRLALERSQRLITD